MKTRNSRKKIFIVWDFDGPIGLINSTYPYNFHIESILEEQSNVKDILDTLDRYNIKAVFAVTGFGCEQRIKPFSVKDIVAEIDRRGHELASHSWRHENFAKLGTEAARRSMVRSKFILEKTVGANKVIGFVLPHNRPMSWLRRVRISFGDYRLFPFQKTGDLSNIIKMLNRCDYKWVRVSGKSFFRSVFKLPTVKRHFRYKGMYVFDNYIGGFDLGEIKEALQRKSEHIMITAHPLMWGVAGKHESKPEFVKMMTLLKELESLDKVEFMLPRDVAF